MPGKSEDILGGFRVNWMNLRDADTGKILWQGNDDLLVLEDSEMQSSVEGNQFHLGGTYGTVQNGTKGSSKGRCLEEWNFNFGFVIPKSTNT